MTKFVSLVLIAAMSYLSLDAQINYTPKEIERLADLGKLWGILHYFHPNMASGTIKTDSLIIRNAESLSKNPSAENFKRCVANMLAQLNDPSTSIENPETTSKSNKLFTPNSEKIAIHQLNGNIKYIAFPTAVVSSKKKLLDAGFDDAIWDNSNGIILDLRNQQNDWMSDFNFTANLLPEIQARLLGKKKLPDLYVRSIFHNGFLSQADNNPNVYSAGWRTDSKNNNKAGDAEKFDKPFLVVLNSNSSDELIRRFLLLKAAGVSKVIIEGSQTGVETGSTYSISLADSLNASVRIDEYYIENGKQLPAPDDFIPHISDTSLNGSFVQKTVQILQSQISGNQQAKTLNLKYVYPKPDLYSNNTYPSTGLRLMGLYNWWNAINYFFPYKHLTNNKWDSVLHRYIPKMINAKDSVDYLLNVCSMASEINDCHGMVFGDNRTTTFKNSLGFWPPVRLAFIENKLVVGGLAKDSLLGMDEIKLWDEITKIDGLTVETAADKWRNFFSTSNESTFNRDVVRHLLKGSQNSKVILDIIRNGKPLSVTLLRNTSTIVSNRLIDFNDDYPTVKLFGDSIGYVNMELLSRIKVDSMMTALEKTKAIIFDIRNYPQGTAWNIAPKLTNTEKKAVLFDKPYVTYDDIFGGEKKSNMKDHFIVYPASKKSMYKGKVIMLCNENTQSQAEYSIMMFQGAANATVIGSQTAGADGNVTTVAIPGGYKIWFSGLGILYPDGTETQRKGIKVDVIIKPTLAGMKEGRDEVLEAALQIAKTTK
jgi:carboxyl-terminal processing protease